MRFFTDRHQNYCGIDLHARSMYLCIQNREGKVVLHRNMKAIHGGKAKNDRIDSRKIAALMRGGTFPMAYVYPARMRATRDLLRRRNHLTRKRAELLSHIQNTNSWCRALTRHQDFETKPGHGRSMKWLTNRLQSTGNGLEHPLDKRSPHKC